MTPSVEVLEEAKLVSGAITHNSGPLCGSAWGGAGAGLRGAGSVLLLDLTGSYTL